jgi:hypothetical protein
MSYLKLLACFFQTVWGAQLRVSTAPTELAEDLPACGLDA